MPERSLKIVHVADANDGGAARATARLHQSLQQLGLDSRLLAEEAISTGGDRRLHDAIVRRYIHLNRTSATNTHFSLCLDGADVSKSALVTSSDIVHLHWTASFQTPADVRALLQIKPVVWTLHDLGPLTGGCHFPAGCENFVKDCDGCPQLIHDPYRITARTLDDKQTLWAGNRITFIAPSRYMAELARRSTVVRSTGATVSHVPNGIDVTVFRPEAKTAARAALGIASAGLLVFCGSFHNAEKRKGLHLVNRIMATASALLNDHRVALKLLTVGDPLLELGDLANVEVIQLGRISGDAMPMAHAAADVFLLPSLEDNFPSMLLEALSCGTPAIGFDVGGVAEIIQSDAFGCVVPAGDELAMAHALTTLLRNGDKRARMGALAREHIQRHFNDRDIASTHAHLYEELLKNSRACVTGQEPVPQTRVEEILPTLGTTCLLQDLAASAERVAYLEAHNEALELRTAALEAESIGLARVITELRSSLDVHHAQLQEKETELTAIHQVAGARQALAEQVHASAENLRTVIAELQSEIRERDVERARLLATIAAQQTEITLVHSVANDRKYLIDVLHDEAEARARATDHLSTPRERPIDLAVRRVFGHRAKR